MALKKCKECGGKVSTKAATCPHCGAKRRVTSLFTKLVMILILVTIVMFFYAGSEVRSKAKSKERSNKIIHNKTESEIRKEMIGDAFSAWDGSHRGLNKFIKDSMNDPGSYEHAETVYWDKTDHLIVKTTFRGKNAFGGVVKNWVMAKTDLNGNVIEIMSSSQ